MGGSAEIPKCMGGLHVYGYSKLIYKRKTLLIRGGVQKTQAKCLGLFLFI